MKRSALHLAIALAFLAFVVAVPWTPAGAQAQDQAPIFRLLTFQAGGETRLGATQGNGEAEIVDIHNAIRALMAANAPEVSGLTYVPPDMKGLIEMGTPAVNVVKSIYRAALAAKTGGKLTDPGGEMRVFYPPTGVKYLSPVPNPQKLYGLAGNYPREGNLANPKYPSAFFKSLTGIIGHNEVIDLNGMATTGVHEPEFAFVIGRKARNVSEAQAMDYVFGYTVHNDVTARDLPAGNHPSQGSAMSKGLDTGGPVGPYITLKEDVPDPHNLAITAKINGKDFPIPNSNTKYLTFKIPALVSFFSHRQTLYPGDIISTGVPQPVVTLKAGDTIEITIDRLGTLRNRVVANANAPGSR